MLVRENSPSIARSFSPIMALDRESGRENEKIKERERERDGIVWSS